MSCKVTILDYNYAFKDNVELIASSEDSEFQVSNLKSPVRSKLWRSSGYYLINAANNKINFRDTALGPELTATITLGEYDSTALCAEIKTQMELVSAFTFTVVFIDGLFSIETSGSYLDLLFSTGTNASTSMRNVLGYNNNDFENDTEYSSVNIAIHTEEFLVIDIKTAEEIDSFAIVFDPFIENYFSTDAQIKLMANATLDFSAPAVNETLSFNETYESIFKFFDTPQEYRYWKIQIIDPDNQNLYIQLPKVVIGKGIQLNRSASIGFNLSLIDQSKKTFTQYGNLFSDIYPIKKQLTFDLNYFDDDDLEQLTKSFYRTGQTEVVFINIDSNEKLLNANYSSIYGCYKNEFGFNHVVKNVFNLGLSIEEVF
jgi:hypothetical protein